MTEDSTSRCDDVEFRQLRRLTIAWRELPPPGDPARVPAIERLRRLAVTIDLDAAQRKLRATGH